MKVGVSMTFGERLVKSREAAGYNQKQLAEALGITPTRLNYWEKDKRQPDVEMIKALSMALNVSADYLIDNISETKNPPSSPDEEFDADTLMNLFSSLSAESQKQALSYLRFLKSEDSEANDK
jgi:transcriptional regulator with XRE-family HTH domain